MMDGRAAVVVARLSRFRLSSQPASTFSQPARRCPLEKAVQSIMLVTKNPTRILGAVARAAYCCRTCSSDAERDELEPS